MAIITYCLVAIVQHDMKLKRSTYGVLQILSISLIDRTHLRNLFDMTYFNDVKDLYAHRYRSYLMNRLTQVSQVLNLQKLKKLEEVIVRYGGL